MEFPSVTQMVVVCLRGLHASILARCKRKREGSSSIRNDIEGSPERESRMGIGDLRLKIQRRALFWTASSIGIRSGGFRFLFRLPVGF